MLHHRMKITCKEQQKNLKGLKRRKIDTVLYHRITSTKTTKILFLINAHNGALNTTVKSSFSHQLSCCSPETLWYRFPQIQVLSPAPQVNWRIAGLSCYKQVCRKTLVNIDTTQEVHACDHGRLKLLLWRFHSLVKLKFIHCTMFPHPQWPGHPGPSRRMATPIQMNLHRPACS